MWDDISVSSYSINPRIREELRRASDENKRMEDLRKELRREALEKMGAAAPAPAPVHA